jgi:hypothetical protein
MSSESGHEPTHQPKAGAKLETSGYHLSVGFHPEIRLEHKKGWDFGKALTEILEPKESDLQDKLWSFTQPQGSSPNCYLSVTVRPSDIQLHVAQPVQSKEWYETRYGLLLKRFADFFRPKLILTSSAMIHGLLQIDGDSRVFLGEQVMNMRSYRADSFGRPIHLLGIRFFFPPFRRKGRKGKEAVTDWQVNVKAESWLEDPSKLYLEADADWPTPQQWTESAVDKIPEHLDVVGNYLEKNVVAFLQHRPKEEKGDEDDRDKT